MTHEEKAVILVTPTIHLIMSKQNNVINKLSIVTHTIKQMFQDETLDINQWDCDTIRRGKHLVEPKRLGQTQSCLSSIVH
jgi:hypothetical protein